MLKLGNLIKHDVFILEETQLNELSKWKENYEYHLINNEFKSCKLGFPASVNQNLIVEIQNSILKLDIQCETFQYWVLTEHDKISEIVEQHTQTNSEKVIHILPSSKVVYKNIGSEFWDLAVRGIEVVFYKVERLKECQRNSSFFKRYSNKGLTMGFTGSPKYSLGIFHKRKLAKLLNDGTINFWISESIYSNDPNYLWESKIKIGLLTAKMQKG